MENMQTRSKTKARRAVKQYRYISVSLEGNNYLNMGVGLITLSRWDTGMKKHDPLIGTY